MRNYSSMCMGCFLRKISNWHLWLFTKGGSPCRLTHAVPTRPHMTEPSPSAPEPSPCEALSDVSSGMLPWTSLSESCWRPWPMPAIATSFGGALPGPEWVQGKPSVCRALQIWPLVSMPQDSTGRAPQSSHQLKRFDPSDLLCLG